MRKIIYFTLLSSRKNLMFCKRGQTCCQDGDETENSNWPTPFILTINLLPTLSALNVTIAHIFKVRTASYLQYFSHNCTNFYRCSEKANATVFAWHEVFTSHMSLVTQSLYMILVLKRSVLTLRYSSSWLLLHAIHVSIYFSIFNSILNVHVSHNIEVKYWKCTNLHKK